jgi:hypothetical protein
MPRGQSRLLARGVVVACVVLLTSLAVVALHDWAKRQPGGASVYVNVVALNSDGELHEAAYVVIRVDGRVRGIARSGTGLQVWLPPGVHRVDCMSPGFQTCTQTVAIKPSDGEAYVHCELQRVRSGYP